MSALTLFCTCRSCNDGAGGSGGADAAAADDCALRPKELLRLMRPPEGLGAVGAGRRESKSGALMRVGASVVMLGFSDLLRPEKDRLRVIRRLPVDADGSGCADGTAALLDAGVWEGWLFLSLPKESVRFNSPMVMRRTPFLFEGSRRQ